MRVRVAALLLIVNIDARGDTFFMARVDGMLISIFFFFMAGGVGCAEEREKRFYGREEGDKSTRLYNGRYGG